VDAILVDGETKRGSASFSLVLIRGVETVLDLTLPYECRCGLETDVRVRGVGQGAESDYGGEAAAAAEAARKAKEDAHRTAGLAPCPACGRRDERAVLLSRLRFGGAILAGGLLGPAVFSVAASDNPLLLVIVSVIGVAAAVGLTKPKDPRELTAFAEVPQSPRMLSPEELERLVSAEEIPLRRRALYLLGARTQLGRPTLASLEWSAVDLKAGRARVRNRRGDLVQVSLDDAVIRLLKQLKAERAHKRVARSSKAVFSSIPTLQTLGKDLDRVGLDPRERSFGSLYQL
jgi:integrase